jgi:hypothetical protein
MTKSVILAILLLNSAIYCGSAVDAEEVSINLTKGEPQDLEGCKKISFVYKKMYY